MVKGTLWTTPPFYYPLWLEAMLCHLAYSSRSSCQVGVDAGLPARDDIILILRGHTRAEGETVDRG